MKRNLKEVCKTRQEVLDAMIACDANIRSVKSQLAEVKAKRFITGEFADSSWFAKANGALSHLIGEKQRLQLLSTEYRRSELSARSMGMERAFVDAAMVVLTKDQVKSIWDYAHSYVIKEPVLIEEVPAEGAQR